MLGPPGIVPPRSPYFVNAWLDAAVIGGLSIVVLGIMTLVSDGEKTAMTIQAAALLGVFVNYPHFSATIYRLYQSSENVRQFPVTSFGLPLLLTGAVTASLWQPETVAPYFVALFLFWSPYHYSGQTIGITMLYARRSGFEIGRRQRLALSAFVYSTFIVSFANPRILEPVIRYGVVVPVIRFPVWFDLVMTTVMYGGAAAFLWFAFSWCRSRKCMLPPIILLPAVTQFVWFFPGKQTATFYEFVPLFHSLQYLYIAWAMQIGLRAARGDAQETGTVFRESARWALRNYAGGMLLFIALPWLLFWVDVPMVTVAGIVIAAVNIHHFFVDGVIWKLRNKTTAAPLMMDISDWHASPRPVAA